MLDNYGKRECKDNVKAPDSTSKLSLHLQLS